jgi:tRNA pseudouridine55 synthase
VSSRPRTAAVVDGLVVVDKPAGWTSHDVVARLRGVYGQRRIGHAGTLDPDATGVLLVGLGRVTRLLRYIADTKTYRGDVVFGVATSTLDASGEVLDRRPMPVGRADLERATRRFVGDIEQVPPMVSAVWVGGRRLHDLEREGITVDRAPRRVRIEHLAVEDLTEGPYPVATITVSCGSGTYIRTLASDLGEVLGGCAHLGALRRLSVGSFTLEEARTLDDVVAAPEAAVQSARVAVRDLPRVDLDPEQSRAVRHGVTFATCALPTAEGTGPFACFSDTGELLAVYERRGPALRAAVVVKPADPRAARTGGEDP